MRKQEAIKMNAKFKEQLGSKDDSFINYDKLFKTYNSTIQDFASKLEEFNPTMESLVKTGAEIWSKISLNPF